MTDFATKGSKQSYKEFDEIKITKSLSSEEIKVQKTPSDDDDAVNLKYFNTNGSNTNFDGGDSLSIPVLNIDGGNSNNN